MTDLSPILPILKKAAPSLAIALGGPLEIVLIGALCLAFNVAPDKLVDAMLDADKRDEVGEKIKNIVLPT